MYIDGMCAYIYICIYTRIESVVKTLDHMHTDAS